jgi:hypothetical protein
MGYLEVLFAVWKTAWLSHRVSFFGTGTLYLIETVPPFKYKCKSKTKKIAATSD